MLTLKTNIVIADNRFS